MLNPLTIKIIVYSFTDYTVGLKADGDPNPGSSSEKRPAFKWAFDWCYMNA